LRGRRAYRHRVASFVLAFLFSVVLVFTIINVADIC
jgi:hypothetical protein